MRIIKIPYNAGCLGKNTGTEKAPDAVEAALKELCLSEKGITREYEIKSIQVNNSNISESMAAISDIRKDDIIIGGDHSITYKCFKESKCDSIIVFDAHPDLMNSSLTHEDWLRNLINDGIVKKENIILVAIRDFDAAELEFMRLNKIKCFFMKDIFNNIEEVCDTMMENARSFSRLYISIDIDAVDPAFAPGTGCIAPAGLTSRELIYFIQRIKNLKNISNWDVVEINPEKDVNNLTVSLGAKVTKEITA